MAKKLVDSRDRDAWLAARADLLTASDMAVLLGVSPFKSRLTLWLEKTGRLGLGSDQQSASSEAMELGLLLEPYILQRLEQEIGQPVHADGWLYSSDDHPWLGATCDGRSGNEGWPCEAKLVGPYAAKSWLDGEVPEHYQVQVQAQMLVHGASGAYIGALVGGTKYRWAELSADREMHARIVEAGEEFRRLVEQDIPPESDGSEETGRAVRDAVSLAAIVDAVTLDHEYAVIDDRIQELRAAEADARKGRTALEHRLELAIGHAELAHLGNGVSYRRVTSVRNYKAQPARQTTTTTLKRIAK